MFLPINVHKELIFLKTKAVHQRQTVLLLLLSTNLPILSRSCCCCWVTTGAWGWSLEALGLRVEGGRVSHSWCMCVVVMAMVGWMGAGMELVFGKHAGQSPGVSRMSKDARVHFECEVIDWWFPITPPSRCAVLFRVEPELVDLPGNA